MLSALYRNIATVSIGLVVCVFAWIYGGTRPDLLRPVMPWLYALMFEMMLCFPQYNRGESIYEARARVWHDLKRDPLMWVSVAFFGILAVALANAGLCPTCEAAVIAQGADPHPELPFLPYCVDRLEHLTTMIWFVPTLTAALAVKHALLKPGKRNLVKLIVWNGVLVALFGFVQAAMGAEGPFWETHTGPFAAPKFFSVFGYANQAGAFFTFLFALSMAMWRWRVDEINAGINDETIVMEQKHYGVFWRKHYYLIPAMIFFFAAINTLSRAAIVSCTGLALIFALMTTTVYLSKIPFARRMKMSLICVPLLLATLGIGFMAMPADVKSEIATVDDRAIADRLSGRSENQDGIAMAIWKDHPVFGCGGWGYRHLSPGKRVELKMKPRTELGAWLGAANVHNDYLQFLVEHGAVGLALLGAAVLILLWPVLRVWRLLIRAGRFAKPKDRPPHPIPLFALPAPAFCILCGCFATAVHALGDCPLRSPAILSMWFVSLAAIPGFMPTLHRR